MATTTTTTAEAGASVAGAVTDAAGVWKVVAVVIGIGLPIFLAWFTAQANTPNVVVEAQADPVIQKRAEDALAAWDEAHK